MANKKVRVLISGGVAHVDRVPPGVVVEVLDYDIDGELDRRLCDCGTDGKHTHYAKRAEAVR